MPNLLSHTGQGNNLMKVDEFISIIFHFVVYPVCLFFSFNQEKNFFIMLSLKKMEIIIMVPWIIYSFHKNF